MYHSRISGLGFYVPNNVVTNDDLSKIMDTNDEWIQERTGIKERRHIIRGEDTTTSMGVKAAKIAIERSGVSKEEIDFVVQKIGENIKLGKIEILDKSSGNIGVYIHDGKKGIVAILDGGDNALSKDIAMHITAMQPEFITLDEIPTETKEAVTALMKEEVDASKPADIQEKMLTGKVAGYFKEKVLTEQSFIKDQGITIGKLLDSKNAKIKSVQRVSI